MRYKNARSQGDHKVDPSRLLRRELGSQDFDERRSVCYEGYLVAYLVKGAEGDIPTMTMRYHNLPGTGILRLLRANVLGQLARCLVSFPHRVRTRPGKRRHPSRKPVLGDRPRESAPKFAAFREPKPFRPKARWPHPIEQGEEYVS